MMKWFNPIFDSSSDVADLLLGCSAVSMHSPPLHDVLFRYVICNLSACLSICLSVCCFVCDFPLFASSSTILLTMHFSLFFFMIYHLFVSYRFFLLYFQCHLKTASVAPLPKTHYHSRYHTETRLHHHKSCGYVLSFLAAVLCLVCFVCFLCFCTISYVYFDSCLRVVLLTLFCHTYSPISLLSSELSEIFLGKCVETCSAADIVTLLTGISGNTQLKKIAMYSTAVDDKGEGY